MPYIRSSTRTDLDMHLVPLTKELISRGDNFEGDLNYSISFILNALCETKLSYAAANRIIGALECAKLEFYRRVAAPYEDKKIEENGDVYLIDETQD